MTRGRPALHLKLARTRDGFCAAAGPERLRITGPVADGAVHLWRAHADAILIGIGTARADDPSLTVRLPGLAGRSPLRIVLDSHLLPLAGQRPGPHRPGCPDPGPHHPRRPGPCPPGPGGAGRRGRDRRRRTAAGGIDLPAALAVLGERGLTRLCSEGGPRLAEALAQADLIEACTLVTGPAELRIARAACRRSARHSTASLAGDRFREAEHAAISGRTRP